MEENLILVVKEILLVLFGNDANKISQINLISMASRGAPSCLFVQRANITQQSTAFSGAKGYEASKHTIIILKLQDLRQ